MKKYKLIKKYPASPPLNSIAEINDADKLYCVVSNGEMDNKVIYSNTFGRIYVEDYPEYWEEIIEKDYEILSLSINGSHAWVLQEDGNYKSLGPYKHNLDVLLSGFNGQFNNIETKILSVKRLSDGEIFTIGDEVKYKVFGKIVDTSLSTITGFNLIDNFIYIVTTTSSNWCKLGDDVLKHKKPLFVTEDGVEIFDSKQNVQFLYKPELRLAAYNNYDGISESVRIFDGSDGYLVFSTKEKAQEYIDLNKPKYSLNDITKLLELLDNNQDNYICKNYKELSEYLIKKLNK